MATGRFEGWIASNTESVAASFDIRISLWPCCDLMRRTLTKYPWGSVVSHKFPLEQINEAFIQQDKGHVTRAAIVPN